MASAGLLHVMYGDWRSGPGGGAWTVPLIAYVAILIAALVLFSSAIRRDEAETFPERSPAVAVAGAAIWSIAFFYAVQFLGLAVGTFTAVSVAIFMLSPRQPSTWPKIVVLAAATSLSFWLLFSLLAPIILRRPLFF